MKKLFALGIIFLLITSIFLIFVPKIEAQNRFSGKGSGTPWDPYIITNVKQLQEMKYDLKAYYVLGNDIDASETKNWNNGQGFEPIGDIDNPFTGSFDGRGYKIYNLYINRVGDFVGLFGAVGARGIIKNIGLENVTIITDGYYSIGGLVGYNFGTIYNVYSTGTIKGVRFAGGLVGLNEGTVYNCYSKASVDGISEVGGLVGWNYYEGTVYNSYSMASVNGIDKVGGLVGENEGTIYNCYSIGTAAGKWNVGGLVGVNKGTVANSFWDIEKSGLEISAAGTGKTTAEMKNVRTYTDMAWSKGLIYPWDFVGNPYDDKGIEDIWDIDPNINDGYPYLTTIKIGELANVNVKAKGSNEMQWLLYIIFAGIIGGMIAILFILIRKLKDLRLQSTDTR
ncbi:MAG: GLUG motif-containing protein [Thermoproteota archaeon]|nr:GLUG motif-containing protein [Thermoproteota archaeon]